MELTEKAKRIFVRDLYATKTTGIEILEVKEEMTTCRLKISEDHKNANGFVMGGAIFTLCDFCFAVHANSFHPITVTISSNVQFLKGAKGDLTCKCLMTKRTKSLCFYQCQVFEGDVLIANTQTIGAIKEGVLQG